MEKGSPLHKIHEEYNIGDVHPFYDAKSETWYMFYLKPGDYGSRLMTSRDMLHWTEQEIQFEYNVAPVKYYVLGVVKDGGKYRSFFGRSSYHGSSESSDLLTWKNSPAACKIPNDITLFPVGARDPYVFFDPDEKVYRCVSTAYRTNREWKSGDTMDCSIALSSTAQNSLNSWSGGQKELIRFPDGYKGEPECSQMEKIGDRWYLFASLARRTNNHVGRPTYWIGDAGKKLLENDWQNKPEYSLDGDDLCAAQLASDGRKYLLFGWIEKKWQGGDWGGHLNLPHEVRQRADGTLATRLEKTVGEKIRGRQLARLDKVTLSGGQAKAFEGSYTRVDMEARLTLQNSVASLMIGDIKVQLNAKNSFISVNKDESDPTSYFATYRVPEGALDGAVSVRIIAEDDIIEAFVNDEYALCARISGSIKDAKLQIQANDGTVIVEQAAVYRLKFLEEIPTP